MTAEPSETTVVSLNKKGLPGDQWMIWFRLGRSLIETVLPKESALSGLGWCWYNWGGMFRAIFFLVLITSAIASETLDALVDAT